MAKKQYSVPAYVHEESLVKLFGVTGRAIRKLSEDGWIPKPEKAIYPLAETVLAWGRYQRAQGSKLSDLERERLRKVKEEADKLSMDNEERRKVLIHRKVIGETFGRFFVSLQQRIMAIPHLTQEQKRALCKDMSDADRIRADVFGGDASVGSPTQATSNG